MTDVALTSSDQVVIDLEKPIKVDDDVEFTRLTLVRPYSGHLRGVSVRDVLNFENDALLTILPRITKPSFPSPLHSQLTLADMVRIGDGIAYFLGATPAQGASPTA
jgi:hypothetical protein